MRILSLSGFIPEQICDTVRFIRYNGSAISHYCGYASDYISQVMHDEHIDGAVFPKSCDSARIIGGYLYNSNKFIHQINIPPAGVEGNVEFFAKEIQRYKEAVEGYYQIIIDNNCIDDRIAKINIRNVALKSLYLNLEKIQYSDYLRVIHELLMKPLDEQIVPPVIQKERIGKRVFIIGSFLSNLRAIETLEKANLVVVGDTLPESGRLVSQEEIYESNDRYYAIANSILSQRMSPTRDDFKTMLERDLAEIEEKCVQGVIFITQQYCEAYDYYFSVVQAALKAKGISSIKVLLNGTNDLGKTELAMEAFSDSL